MDKIKVGFICVHNSCRSQIAEAFGKEFLSDHFECYSAGTETKPFINLDAVRIMKEQYHIDMSHQYSKLITSLPNLDIVITMGCNVFCPSLPCSKRMDWNLEDPTGKNDDVFIKVIDQIKENILLLEEEYKNL